MKSNKKIIKELSEFCGKPLRYITSRDSETNTEVVVGRNGFISIVDNQLCVVCGGEYLFRGDINEVTAGELLSHNGVMIKGTDIGGNYKCLVGHYVYFR